MKHSDNLLIINGSYKTWLNNSFHNSRSYDKTCFTQKIGVGREKGAVDMTSLANKLCFEQPDIHVPAAKKWETVGKRG